MRPFLILILFLFTQCTSENQKELAEERVVLDSIINLDVDENKIAVVELFPEYEYIGKDTIFKSSDYGGESELITLGVCEIESVQYSAITKFSSIPFADGMRGRSFLYLISMDNDTIIYDAEMPEELPIDIYKNNFVFLNQNNEYEFSELELFGNDAACFNADINKCFWGW